MSAEYFIDTNLFIYQIESTDNAKAVVANRIIRAGIETGNACISLQVVQECLNTILHKAAICLSKDQAMQYLDASLAPLLRVYPSIPLYQHGLEVQSRYRFSFYDSLIIAAALEAGCNTLYSEDLQHGQVVGALRVENPFLKDDS